MVGKRDVTLVTPWISMNTVVPRWGDAPPAPSPKWMLRFFDGMGPWVALLKARMAPCADRISEFRSVCAVCGPGNNGAAGLAAHVLSAIAERTSVVIPAYDESTLSAEPGTDKKRQFAMFVPLWSSEKSFVLKFIRLLLTADVFLHKTLRQACEEPESFRQFQV